MNSGRWIMHNAKPIPKMTDKQLRNFYDKIRLPNENGCMLWNGATARGYGRVRLDKTLFPAHRVSYYLAYGQPSPYLVLDHICGDRSCVNPDHLEPVTPKENILRGAGFTASHAKKTHCPKGHPYKGSNLTIGSKGERRCKICDRDWHRNYRSQKKETNEVV